MTAQIAAGRIADAQFCNEVRIMKTSLPQILSGFCMSMELYLVKGGGFLHQRVVSGQSEILLSR